jgi:hypothetical protein
VQDSHGFLSLEQCAAVDSQAVTALRGRIHGDGSGEETGRRLGGQGKAG